MELLKDARMTQHPKSMADAGSMADLDARKRAEAAWRESENRYRDLFENASLAIFQSGLDGCVIDVNPEFARLFGYQSPEEVKASVKHASEIFADPRRREEIIRLQAGKTGPHRFENEYRRKDGSTFCGQLTVRSVLGTSGQIMYFEGFIEDITDRKRLEQRLREAYKIEGIGHLAGGVAHHFNNILASMMMNLGLLDMTVKDSQTRESLKEMTSLSARTAALVRQLQAFGQKSLLRTRPLDLNQVVKNHSQMLRRLLDEKIVLVYEGAADLPKVNADADLIQEVVLVLCLNAKDAMPQGGRLSLRLREEQVHAERTQSHPDARPGKYVSLSVTDTGCGMGEATLKRLFEPFFTTKDIGEGTGLGLSTVHGIVRQHQGWIEVDSQVGHGTTFRIFLPAAGAP
jgi:PAS domain S-box-containing protein